MRVHLLFRHALSFIVAIAAVLVTVWPSLASDDTLANARDATAIFNDPAAALGAGYELLTDASGAACIQMPGAGAMGVHYVKSALVQSGALDPARPQALVYEVQPDGRLHLVALEYVVFQSTWDTSHGVPPMLFGQQFMLNPDGNRFGLPAFYSLHAWVWEHNPRGMFEPYNPRVDCASPANADTPSDAQPASEMEGM